MNTGLKLSGGKEKRVAQWLESAYLWNALFVAVAATAVWKVGAAET